MVSPGSNSSSWGSPDEAPPSHLGFQKEFHDGVIVVVMECDLFSERWPVHKHGIPIEMETWMRLPPYKSDSKVKAGSTATQEQIQLPPAKSSKVMAVSLAGAFALDALVLSRRRLPVRWPWFAGTGTEILVGWQ